MNFKIYECSSWEPGIPKPKESLWERFVVYLKTLIKIQ